jgi:hypothetical protein
VQEKRAARQEAKATELKLNLPTFEECAEIYIRERWNLSQNALADQHIPVHRRGEQDDDHILTSWRRVPGDLKGMLVPG